MMKEEQLKTYPWGAVWDEYCARCGVPAEDTLYACIKEYEDTVLSKRV